ncbi:MAG TPA: iron-containing alcohol dehydrogenase [Chloroflexota bacterium]|nr:iron-containing alcohol dehydrogenase [Chloroflexota bacterium]
MTNQPSHPDFEMVPVGSYDFLQLDKVTFGPGTSKDLSDEIGRLNCSLPFFITSGPAGTRLIDDAGFAPSGKVELGTAPWPDAHGVARVVDALKAADVDVVVTVGGEGAIATAKGAILALARDTGHFPAHVVLPTDVTGQPFSPVVSMRDTASGSWTGTSNPFVTPSLVILDARLSENTDDDTWLAGAALSIQQAVETVSAPNHQPATDATALEALRLLAMQAADSVGAGASREAARQQCLLAGWLAAFGMANITLGLSDALSREIGARYNRHPGDVAAVILPKVMAMLLPGTPSRQARVASALAAAGDGRGENAPALEAPPAVYELMRALGRPDRLRDLGITEADLPTLAGNRPEILSVLREAL